MTVSTLLTQLAKLDAAGFGKSSVGSHKGHPVYLQLYTSPENTIGIDYDIDGHDEVPTDVRWAVMGWLCDVLAARGLKRSVVPFAPEADFAATHWRVTVLGQRYEAPTELEALLAACRAVAEERGQKA